MKILVSVYACAPGKGSEPGVGWNWIRQLSAQLPYAQIFALTQSKNKTQTSIAINKEGINNVHLLDFSFGRNDNLIKKLFGRQIHHLLWQFFVFYKLNKEFPRKHFDIVHHLTYVSLFYPVRTYHFGKRFILGPVAGGDFAEQKLLIGVPSRYKLLEYVKQFFISTRLFIPFCRHQLKQSETILCATEETQKLIPDAFIEKTAIFPAIGCERNSVMPCKKDPTRIIYCGHFKFWKGIHLAMHAFALARKNNPNLHLLLVGKGNIRLWMNTFLKSNKLAESVKILDWLPQDKLQTELSKSGLLLLPSLRDSGGMVILEALASGTPVIALDKAGPGTILKNHRRFLIDTEKRSQNEIISSIADRIVQITSCEKNFTEASIAAIMCAEENSWKNRINEFIEQYVR